LTASAVLLVAVTLLVVLSTPTAHAMTLSTSTARAHTAIAQLSSRGLVPAQPLTPAGSITLQWGNSTLSAQVNVTGLAANTLTQGFIVPGTCANPGGTATFRTRAVTSDANGNVSGSGTKTGMQRSGIRLPKAFEVVQNGQIVLCADTMQNPTTESTTGLAVSGSETLTLNPASGPAPKQVHRTHAING
jgi:hypothetical protein